MILFDNVSKRYPSGFEALTQISFELSSSSLTFLTGHSGAGKSTLLKLIMLMERPSQGQIIIDSQNVTRLHQRYIPAHRQSIGAVFQNHQLLFDRTVFENVSLPMRILGFSESETRRRVQAALDKVGLLRKEKMMPIQLSGGEQQRIGIARAVVHKPKILLADEPTGNLDPELSAEIMNVFVQFQLVGVTVLIATHDIALISSFDKQSMDLSKGVLMNQSDFEASCES